MSTINHLKTAANDRQLSHEAFMMTVAICFDGQVREPDELHMNAIAARKSFVQELIGKNARQRKFRKLLRRGDDRAIESLNEINRAWGQWQAAADEAASG